MNRTTRLIAAGVTLFAVATYDTAWAGDEVITEQGIEYANPADQHLKLDLTRPDGEGPYPAIVCIHGGGFRSGDRSAYKALCEKLAKHGYVAVTIDYRLAPQFPFPAAVHDCKAAVRWLRANAAKYHIDPQRIGAMGGSAGGTLAEFLGVTEGKKQFEGDGGNPDQPSRVKCVVEFFGANDFTKSYGKSVDAAEVLPLYLGGNLEEARERHVEASPINWVTKNAAPTLCIHGADDKYVALEQSELMVGKLKAAGVEAKLEALKGAGHGFKGTDEERAEAAMIKFFDAHLKNKTTP
jgi:acetyl esterase/lipase